jgi:hypothetical protein
MSYDKGALADAKDLAIITIGKDKAPTQKISKEDYVRSNRQTLVEHWGGYGLLCGERSKNVEAIDIDLKYDETGTLWTDYKREVINLDKKLLKKLCIHKTVSGGFHLIYRCDYVEGNKKLARRPDDSITKTKVLIETRGEGGYIAIPPTDGYEKLQGSLFMIPTITTEERAVLFNCAKLFHKVNENEVLDKMSRDRSKYTSNPNHEDNPFEEYNKHGDVLNVLTKHGWEVVKEKGTKLLLKRPGNTDNRWSADLDDVGGIKMFYVYTSSTQFEPERVYSPSEVYVMLECNGDWSEAAKNLRNAGYANAPGKRKDIQDTEFIQRPIGKIDDELDSVRITSATKVPPIYQILSINDCLVGSRGNVVGISGPVKVGKSAIINLLISKSLNHESDGFSPVVVRPNRGGDPVIHIDTEQSLAKHKENIDKWILPRTGFKETPPYFYSYNFRPFTVRQAREALARLMDRLYQQHKAIHMVMIDGISEFVRSPNDEEGSLTIMKLLMELSAKYNTLIVVVLHTNPTKDDSKKERGHLGSELQRKAESVLTVDSDDFDARTSILSARWLRNDHPKNMGNIKFRYDSETSRHEIFYGDNEINEYDLMVNYASKVRNNMTKYQFYEMVMKAISCSLPKAKSILSQLKDLNLISLQGEHIFKNEASIGEKAEDRDEPDTNSTGVQESKEKAPF